MSETRLWHPFADMSHVRDAELVLDRGDDVWIWDVDGKQYLDATASLWYANVGHGRQEIVEAAAAQMGRLEAYSAFGDFTTEAATELAGRLSDLSPMEDTKIFFGSGGGDGIDTAAKLARRYWQAVGQPQRVHLISRLGGYHGTHGYGTSLAGIEANRSGFGVFDPATSSVPHDDVGALAAAFDRIGPDNVAAFFCEPVIGAGGVFPPAPGYIEACANLCAEAGVLFIADCVICGFGRLGSWWGVERFGIEPDMITFAKGVTSGYLPLGGVAVSGRVAAPFWEEGAPDLPPRRDVRRPRDVLRRRAREPRHPRPRGPHPARAGARGRALHGARAAGHGPFGVGDPRRDRLAGGRRHPPGGARRAAGRAVRRRRGRPRRRRAGARAGRGCRGIPAAHHPA